MKMAENGLKWLKMAGMSGNDMKCLERDGNAWKLLEMAEMAKAWLK